MSPSLINDKTTLQSYVRISFINEESSLPDFSASAIRYLIPIIGNDLYEYLLDTVIQHDFPEENADPEEMDDEDQQLLHRCRAVIAPLAYKDELPTIHTMITDSGLRTHSTENLQAAHRWEYEKVESQLANQGLVAMEQLLTFLFKEPGAFPLWLESEEYKDANALIFRTGTEFQKCFHILNPFSTWWQLRPIIKEVEDFTITPLIGEDFFSELKNQASHDANVMTVINLVKKSVAQLTIVRAIEKGMVKITPQGLTAIIGAGSADATNAGDEVARDNQISLLYKSCQRDGYAYSAQLKEHLNKTASLSIFQTYFDSLFYQAPQSILSKPFNEGKRNFFL